MRSLRASQVARCSANHWSASDSAFGRSSQVRTPPTLAERIMPLRSRTGCFINDDGSAIANGAAMGAVDLLSCQAASASARASRSNHHGPKAGAPIGRLSR